MNDDVKGLLYRSEDGRILYYYDPELDRIISIHPGDHLRLDFKEDRGPGSITGLDTEVRPTLSSNIAGPSWWCRNRYLIIGVLIGVLIGAGICLVL